MPNVPQNQQPEATRDHNMLSAMEVALQDEIKAAKRSRHRITLFDGDLISKKDGVYAYRFELPEGVTLANVEEIEIGVDQGMVEGEVASVDSQFVVINLEEDLGKKVEKLSIEWSTTVVLEKMLERIGEMKSQPDKFNMSLMSDLFSPQKTSVSSPFSGVALEDDIRTPNQRKAIRGALSNKISFVWGPPGTGKTSTLGFIACSLVERGERVLLVSNTNRAVDVALQQVIKCFKTFKKEWKDRITRYGRPFILDDPDLDRIFFTNQIQAARERLISNVEKQAALISKYERFAKRAAEHDQLVAEVESAKRKLLGIQTKRAGLQKTLDSTRQRAQKLEGLGGLLAEFGEVTHRVSAFNAILEDARNKRARADQEDHLLQAKGQDLKKATERIEKRNKGGLLSIVGTFLGPSRESLEREKNSASAAVLAAKKSYQDALSLAAAADKRVEEQVDRTQLARLRELETELARHAIDLQIVALTKPGFSTDAAIKTLREEATRLTSEIEKGQGTLIEQQKQVDAFIAKINTADIASQRAKFDAVKAEIASNGGVEQIKAFVQENTKVDEEALLKEMRLIGATLAKSVANRAIASSRYDAILVDEASMVSLPYLAILAAIAHKRVIVVGDPQQLPPIALAYSEHAQRWLERDMFMQASGSQNVDQLFAWHDANPEFTYFLDTDYRMTGELSGIINDLFYAGRLKNGRVNEEEDELAGIQLIDTASLSPTLSELPSGKGKFPVYNPVHTEKIVDVVRVLSEGGLVDAGEIGIVVPLNSAAVWIRQELKKAGFRSVEVGTVHTFQGREKQVIIFDTVVSGVDFTIRPFDEQKTGDAVKRLLNVALSRTKKTLVVVANMRHFRSVYRDRLVLRVLGRIEKASRIAEHPDVEDPEIEDEIIVEDFGVEGGVDLELQDDLDPSDPPIQEVLHDHPVTTVLVKEPDVTATVQAPPPGDRGMPPEIVSQPSVDSKRSVLKDVQKLGHEITSLRGEINVLSTRLRGAPLFKLSVEGEQIAGKLPQTVVSSEGTFKDWIDSVYKYFYESSGGPNAGPPIVDRQVDVTKIRWHINRLRNGFFHDSAHTDDPVRDAETQRKVYDHFIGKPYPTQSHEWTALQLSVMYQVVEWLKYIVGRLRG